MREIFTSGSAGRALGNQCLYPENGPNQKHAQGRSTPVDASDLLLGWDVRWSIWLRSQYPACFPPSIGVQSRAPGRRCFLIDPACNPCGFLHRQWNVALPEPCTVVPELSAPAQLTYCLPSPDNHLVIPRNGRKRANISEKRVWLLLYWNGRTLS